MSMAHILGGLESTNERLRSLQARVAEASVQFSGNNLEPRKPGEVDKFPPSFVGRVDEQFYYMSNIIDDIGAHLTAIEAFAGTLPSPAAPSNANARIMP